LLSRRKIYLDARFWIILRDTDAGVRTEASERKLLHTLRRGVRMGELVCPISTDMLMELLKQSHSAGRRPATAALIDELSMGVTAVDPQVLLLTELNCFFDAGQKERAQLSMQELIWTKVAYAMGHVFPTFENLDEAAETALQKEMYDRRWDLSLVDFVRDLDGDEALKRDFEELTADTNEKNKAHRAELKSFAGAYDIELRGVVEMAGTLAADVVADREKRQSGPATAPTAEQKAASVNLCRNLLYEAMKQAEHRSALRTLHVQALIHAGMRWDKSRNFKINDWHDFGHATIAFTYCDAFFTEKPLHHLVTRPQLDLGAVNGCKVTSDVEEALAIVLSQRKSAGSAHRAE
jgi:hypothetical protein